MEEFLALCVVHREPVAPAQPVVLPPAAVVGDREARNWLRREATLGMAWWQVVARITARRAVTREEIAHRAATDTADREARRDASQDEADATWRRLVANHPATVRVRLESDLEERGSAAQIAWIDARRVILQVVLPGEVCVPLRRPGRTPSGRLTSYALSKTEASSLYQGLVASQLLAILRCVFANAPGMECVEIHADLEDGSRIAQGSFARAGIDALPLHTDDAYAALCGCGLGVRERGRAHTLIPIGDSDRLQPPREPLVVASAATDGASSATATRSSDVPKPSDGQAITIGRRESSAEPPETTTPDIRRFEFVVSASQAETFAWLHARAVKSGVEVTPVAETAFAVAWRGSVIGESGVPAIIEIDVRSASERRSVVGTSVDTLRGNHLDVIRDFAGPLGASMSSIMPARSSAAVVPEDVVHPGLPGCLLLRSASEGGGPDESAR